MENWQHWNEAKNFQTRKILKIFQVLVRLEPRSFLNSSSAVAESSEVHAFAKDKVKTKNPKILKVLIFSKKKTKVSMVTYTEKY